MRLKFWVSANPVAENHDPIGVRGIGVKARGVPGGSPPSPNAKVVSSTGLLRRGAQRLGGEKVVAAVLSAVPGVVDARNTKLESVDEIVTKIGRAAAHVVPERIYVSPNCGLEFLPRPTAYGKLVRMVEGVAKARELLS